jgi:hypothetical protein
VLNTGFALLVFVEIIRLCRRFPIKCNRRVSWSFAKFVTVYLLQKRYACAELQLTKLQECTTDGVDLELANLQNCIDFYKRQVLHPSRTTDVIHGSKTGLDNYIKLVIHTERAKHKFSKIMERHEIFDVYMEVPRTSIR